MITEAGTDAERKNVAELFLRVFDDIDPAAVPMTSADSIYAPLIVQCLDPDDGRLLGAALTCRAQIAAPSVMLAGSSVLTARVPAEQNFTAVLDKHSELDLMAVAPDARGAGIGGGLLAHLENALRKRGVRVWFGHVTTDLQTSALRRFYVRHGFTVLEDGQPLPDLLGKRWQMGGPDPSVAFSFYKPLSGTAPVLTQHR